VSIYLDGRYSFSLTVDQLANFNFKKGDDLSLEEVEAYKDESSYGKLKAAALDYLLLRTRSKKEFRDYLFRKTLPTYDKKGKKIIRYTDAQAKRVYEYFLNTKYLDDEFFAKTWVENRNLKKGVSKKKLYQELKQKGIEDHVIKQALGASGRDDLGELKKVLAKKAGRYKGDDNKLIRYLASLGFNYEDIKKAIEEFKANN
jgi:recX family